MSDALTDSLVDAILYWEPGTLGASGIVEFGEPRLVRNVRIDFRVSYKVLEMLHDKDVSMTVWSLERFAVEGWLCRVEDYDAASDVSAPQLIQGAKQIAFVDAASSLDRSRVFWRAVI